MKDIMDLVQTTLDNLLITETSAVYSFWGRRSEISNDQAAEYIIFSIEDDEADVSADGDVMYRMMSVSLQYYVKYSVARTYTGRQNALDRMDAIREAMRTAGFGCSGGWSEIGDVDDVGFATFRSTYDIPRLMDGE
jgi:hypothetical protein